MSETTSDPLLKQVHDAEIADLQRKQLEAEAKKNIAENERAARLADPLDFRADVLKVTHHGSSDGTAKKVIAAVKPGIAIASTADDEGHRLETATLNRLGGHDGPREIYETLTRGDIILRTDGGAYGNGVLYQVEFKPQGEFAAVLGLDTA